MEYAESKAQAEKELGIKIPDNISIPQPWPKNEFQWWDFIESCGKMQFSFAHQDHRSGVPNHTNAILSIGEQMIFWSKVIADKFNLILPDGCPNGNKSKRAGEKVENKSLIEAITGQPCPDVIPMPPEGKTWWWDWYNEIKNIWEKAKNEEYAKPTWEGYSMNRDADLAAAEQAEKTFLELRQKAEKKNNK